MTTTGYQPAPPAQTPEPDTSRDGMAIASLVLGIVWLGGLGSILAAVFGHLSMKRTARKGIATAGIILGYVGVVGAVLMFVFMSLTASAVNDAVNTPHQPAGNNQQHQPPPGKHEYQPPALTASQQQAITSAKSYLSDGSGFSRAGLIDQLTSSYGEQFSHADAVFAVNYLHPDWNQQAVISAKSYMSDGSGFSRSGLIDQLTSSYGEQFTAAQANYAADQVGL